MNIRAVDLNLLPVFDALVRHRNVSLAARELDLSQSAASSALARLRVLLGDALFVRTGKGLTPTPRAKALAQPISEILERIKEQVTTHTEFAASTSARSFTLCLTDVGAYVLWPRILRAVAARAPHVRLEMTSVSQVDLAAALPDGHVDVAVGSFPELPESLFQRRLFDRRYVFLVSERHPLRGQQMTLRQFAETPQVIVRMSSGIQECMDDALQQHGLVRKHVVEMPSFLMVLPMIERGEYGAMLPGMLAEQFGRLGAFCVLELPVKIPESTIRMYWHRRSKDDPGSAWLRQVIVEELGETEAGS